MISSWLQWLLKHLLCLPGLAIATVLMLLALGVRGRRRRRPGEPPLINGWIPFFGVAFQMGISPHTMLKNYQKKCGDIFTLYINGKYFTFLLDPFQYALVLKNYKQFTFSKFSEQFIHKVFDIKEILKVDQELRDSNKYLKGNSLDELVQQLMQNLQHIMTHQQFQVQNWETSYLYKFCSSLVFEAVFGTLYGKDTRLNSREVMNELIDDFDKFENEFKSLFSPIPTPSQRTAKNIRRKFIQMFEPEYISKLQETSELVKYRHNIIQKHSQLLDYDKGARHFAFMWASLSNTIPSVFWTLYYLIQHPEAVAVLRDEIDHLLQSTGQKKEPDFNIQFTREQLDSLVYLDSVINETFRLMSSSSNVRISEKDITLTMQSGEFSLRKGDAVVIYPPILHFDPEIFEQPEVFKFDRFVEDNKKKTTFFKKGKELPYFLMPFGSGISKCPGRFFAMVNIKQIVILLLMYFDMELIEKFHQVKRSQMFLGIHHPHSDIHFRYKLRC